MNGRHPVAAAICRHHHPSLPLQGNVINLSGTVSKTAFPLEGKVAREAGRKRCPRWAQFVYYDRGTRHRGTPLQSASQTASPQGEAFWARQQVFFLKLMTLPFRGRWYGEAVTDEVVPLPHTFRLAPLPVIPISTFHTKGAVIMPHEHHTTDPNCRSQCGPSAVPAAGAAVEAHGGVCAAGVAGDTRNKGGDKGWTTR